jgi:hypothetical protein
VSTLLPHRTTPERRHLQAKLGALIAYRQAAGVLDTFLPMPSSFTHDATRNRLLCIGQAIEAELQDNIEYQRTVADPVATMAIGVCRSGADEGQCELQRFRARNGANIQKVAIPLSSCWLPAREPDPAAERPRLPNSDSSITPGVAGAHAGPRS